MIDKEFTFEIKNDKKIIVGINSMDIAFFRNRIQYYIGSLVWNNHLQGFEMQTHRAEDEKDLLTFLENTCGINIKYCRIDNICYAWITYENYLNLLTFLKLKGE